MKRLLLVGLTVLAGCANNPGVYIPPPPPPQPTQFHPISGATYNAQPLYAQPQGVPAVLISQRTGQSVTGQPAMVCTYQFAGRTFDKAFPIGTGCPSSLNVQ